MGKLKNPHDRFFKETLSIKENARSFLESYLPDKVSNVIEVDSLEIEKDSFVSEDLRDYYSDLLYKVKVIQERMATFIFCLSINLTAKNGLDFNY